MIDKTQSQTDEERKKSKYHETAEFADHSPFRFRTAFGYQRQEAEISLMGDGRRMCGVEDVLDGCKNKNVQRV
jgi:hypothetical protein